MSKTLDLTRDAAASTEATTPARGPTLLEQFIETHGPAVGPALLEIELAHRRKAAEKFRALHERVTELKRQIGAITAARDVRLRELEREMNQQYEVWLLASAAYERERISIQSATVPLQGQVEQILREINAPLHASRVRNWEERPDLAPQFPPDDA
jgi:hypothetical protein